MHPRVSKSIFIFLIGFLIIFGFTFLIAVAYHGNPAEDCAAAGGTWTGSYCQMPGYNPAADCTSHGGTWTGTTCVFQSPSPSPTYSPSPTPTYSPSPSPSPSPTPSPIPEATKTIKGKVAFQNGQAITDAYVSAFRKDTNLWAQTKTDSSGGYKLSVSGGSWEVSIYPTSSTANWSYNKPPQSVSFALDSTTEEKIIDFIVTSADASVKGKVLKPDGSPPSANTVSVSFRSSEGFEFGGPVDSTGLFTVRLTAGTYTISIYSQDPALSGPSISPISVASGETKNLGTITLVAKGDHIKGVADDKEGKGISGIQVDAYNPEGGSYATAKTNSSGSFDLLVTPGTWDVLPRPDLSSNYYYPDPPKRVSVISGATITINFTLLFADSGVSGTVVDEKGNALTDVYGFAGLSTDTAFGSGPGLGGPIEKGTFSFKAPAGTYKLFIFLPPDSPYTPGPGQNVTITSGKITQVQVTVSKNTSKIVGLVKDETGKAVTGINVEVFAAAEENNLWQQGIVDKTTGKYTIKVSAGTWYLGYHVDPASGYASLQNPTIKVVVTEGATVTKDITIVKANSTITGQVTDPAGKGVHHVFVAVGKTSFSLHSQEQFGFKESIVAGTETDSSGFYKVLVPAGNYFVKTFVHPELGFINAEEKNVTLAEGQTVTLNLQLRKAELKITGKALANEEVVAHAFIWGWSEKGGYSESVSISDGSYKLNVTASESWHIAAAKEINGVFYKSSEIVVRVANQDVVQSIDLLKVAKLPEATLQTTDASKPFVVAVPDGAQVTAPANSISTSGQVSISVTPDTRVASQGEIKVVGVAYNLEARDASGQVVHSFNTDVTVTMSYKESDLKQLGVNEDSLAIGFWDETVATWKPLESCVINKVENAVTCTTIHFTRFALVAAADVTPPKAPTNVKITASGKGELNLTWVNPAKDLRHLKIYRSATQGVLGDAVINDLVAAKHKDTGLTDGTIYYYTVRAVDPAGNESTNTEQISAKAVGTSVKKKISGLPAVPPGIETKLEILKVLKQGNKGDDVKALQELLINEGVYPDGLVTGFFGSLTKKAVIRFQEKYADEILKPFGLTKGTGFVGKTTRNKINQLLK